MALRRLQENTGLQGDVVACREAKVTEYKDLIGLVEAALAKLLSPGEKHPWVHIEGLYAAEVVVKKDGKLFRYTYAIDDSNQVTFGEPHEVLVSYVPAGVTNVLECMAPQEHGHGDGITNTVLLESLDQNKGLKWRVCVVKAGLSGNGKLYPASVLREAVPLFNGCRVLNKADDVHLQGKGKSFENLIGKLSNATFVKASGDNPAHIAADMQLLESANVHEKMLEAHSKDMSDLFGFSIDAYALTKPKKHQGRAIREAVKFTKVTSLDLIIEPGAGGGVINLLEAQEDKSMNLLQRMLEALEKTPELLDGVDLTNESEVLAAYDKLREAQATQGQQTTEKSPAQAAENSGGEGVTNEQLQEALATQGAQFQAITLLRESKLPEKAQAQLKAQFDNAQSLTVEQVTESISEMKELLASVTDSGKINMPDGGARYGNVDDGNQLLEALFNPEDTDVTSIRQVYLDCTGDRHFTGQINQCSQSRMTEALDSTSFPAALGNTINRRMIDLWSNATIYDGWEHFVDIVNVSDFRDQERVVIGGYGDLQDVGENGGYPDLTSPTDNKEKYRVTKRGGRETVTLEMIANDDQGAIARIPQKMVTAARRTLSKFVFGMFATPPLMNDGKAWFHADHKNLGSTAFSGSAYSAVRLAMMRQQEPGSDAELGLVPRYLMVPPELEEQAYDTFKRDTNNDETFVQSLKPMVMPVWCWTDVNNWVASCDKTDHPIIELGFFQGQREPQLFIQDNPNVGSMFTNDATTYKIRHIYGGAPLSSQGVYKQVVA